MTESALVNLWECFTAVCFLPCVAPFMPATQATVDPKALAQTALAK